MVIQYKCSSCGADMNFDSDTGKLHCESCGRYEDINDRPTSEIPAANSETDTVPLEDEIHFNYEEDTAGLNTTFSAEDVRQYHCNSCGAIVITDKDTSATTCSFCSSAVVLGDRLSGELAPAKILPFKISKATAQETFRKWCKNGRLTPKGFMTADRIKSISGMYVPFWLYDINGIGSANATCTQVRRYESGGYIYTETKFFQVYRKVNLSYLKVPADASEKMNDQMMERLEPFDYHDLKNFNMPYLAGYLAEKYNYTDHDLYPQIQKRTASFVESYLRNSIKGYTTISFNNQDISIKQRRSFYTLLPVWMVCYDYKDSEHIFAMNGQTGKIVGKPPISKGKIAAWFTGVSVASFAVLNVVTYLISKFI